MLKLFKYLNKKEWFFVGLSVGFIVLQVWLDLTLPDYMSKITKLVQTPGSKVADIWKNGGIMLGCAFGSAAASVVVGYCAARVASSLSFWLRNAVFLKVQSFSAAEINKFSTASLITRSTNDITQIQNTVSISMQVLVKAPIMATWAICKIVGKSWQWSVATAVAVVVLVLAILLIMILTSPFFKKIQQQNDDLNRIMRENLMGLRVVRAFNAENYTEDKFEQSNTKLTKSVIFVDRVFSAMSPVMSIVMSGLSLSIFWIGVGIINHTAIGGKLDVFADMVVFSSYATQVVMSFMMLTFLFIFLPRALVSAKRINEVLMSQSSIKDGSFDGNTAQKGVVEFKNVSFRYPDAEEYVLHNISFRAEKGQTVAFIGSTGSGKSTLINLVPRFYDASVGQILVDGVDVKDYKMEALNNKLGYVSQKAVMFNGTIRSNVSLGQDNASDEVLNNAIETAQAKDFVSNMENGLDATIVQGGKNVSGGQKQRLSIARALAKNPEIMIFDDSFSALDYKTDKNLRSALSKMDDKPTRLIVAQRIGTIKDADQIVVLDSGEMVGIGTHSELLKNCEVYREIAESQLSKEEL